jgi:general secretion pathway protein K
MNLLTFRLDVKRSAGTLSRRGYGPEPTLVTRRTAGRAYRPRNGPFQSVDELKLVMDMTPPLFKRLAPALTVYSGSPYTSTPAWRRRRFCSRSPAWTKARSRPSSPPAPLVGWAFSIRIELQSPNGPSFRDVAIRLTARPDKPYWVLSWKSL